MEASLAFLHHRGPSRTGLPPEIGEQRRAGSAASVSAIVLPFAPSCPVCLSITQAERARAAAWAAHRAAVAGTIWWVETHLTEEGAAWVGLVTPSSRSTGPVPSLAWLIERTGRGLELTRTTTWRTKVFHTIGAALTSIDAVEEHARKTKLKAASADGSSDLARRSGRQPSCIDVGTPAT